VRALAREGFTLVEVLVAMVLLSFAILGAQALLTDRLLGSVGKIDLRGTALQLASDRVQTVQADPGYESLAGRYSGTETDIPGFGGFRRITDCAVDSGYTRVTVRVVTPDQRDTVSRTVVVGQP
jgi:prepilin-type N-terminal cleavage/methylation domain-containing protein